MTTIQNLPAPTVRKAQWQRATGWLLPIHLYLLTWFWAVCSVVVITATIITDRVGSVEVSIFQFVRAGALWYPFSLAIIITVGHLTLHVTSGMTRRSYVQAAVVTSVVVGLVNSLVMLAGLLLERWVYSGLDWPHVVNSADGPVLEGGVAQWVLSEFLIYTAGLISGLLVGMSYYRIGGWATLALPLTMLPLVGVDLAGGSGDTWIPFGSSLDLSPPLAVPLALLSIAAGIAAFYLLTRRVPIHSRGS